MTDPMFPTDISPREAELGFQKVQIFAAPGFGSLFSSGWVIVVAKILGDSDVILKTTFGGNPVYVHRRFGKFTSPIADQMKNQKPEWHPISNGFQKDPQQAIMDASFEADVALAVKINPLKAEYRFDFT